MELERFSQKHPPHLPSVSAALSVAVMSRRGPRRKHGVRTEPGQELPLFAVRRQCGHPRQQEVLVVGTNQRGDLGVYRIGL